MSTKEARKHLDLAKKQWDDAAVDSWEPEEPESCVSNVFYAYENLIVAVAELNGIRWKRNHYDKADLAATLAQQGKLKKNVRDLILHLNDVRKDISYGEPGSDLRNEHLEQLVTNLEHMVDEVEELVSRKEASTGARRK